VRAIPYRLGINEFEIMHIRYEQRLGHQADFKVRYRFYNKDECGRSAIPYQGYRSDFWYAHQDHNANEIFMIWPEFENLDGEVILQSDCSVNQSGTARMWIIVPERRPYHHYKIKLGTIGYFMEGAKKVAECEVVELMGLLSNPVASQ